MKIYLKPWWNVVLDLYGSIMIYPFKKRLIYMDLLWFIDLRNVFPFCMKYHGKYVLFSPATPYSLCVTQFVEAWKSCDGREIWNKTCCSIGPWPKDAPGGSRNKAGSSRVIAIDIPTNNYREKSCNEHNLAQFDITEGNCLEQSV